MVFDSYCVACLLSRQAELSREILGAEKAYRFMREASRIIADAPEGVSGSYLTYCFHELYREFGVTEDLYEKEKKDSNDYVLSVLPQAQKCIDEAADPLLVALKYAQIGNFLDFGVLNKEDVDSHFADDVAGAPNLPLDETEYRHFVEDLTAAKQLLILGDNAGEIAFDTLLVKQLQKSFPSLSIIYCVRGGKALNDATREDAAYVGMDKLTTVIDSGSGIPSTELKYIGEELKRAFATADVILAKGQANFESLLLSGYNIYFNFLCKCDRIGKILGVPLFTGCFLNERRMKSLSPFPA